MTFENVFQAISYAREQKRRIPEVETWILEHKNDITHYVMSIMKNERWPEGEKVLLQGPEFNEAIGYAQFVLNSRWSELEPLIVGNPQYASRYTLAVVNGRWPEAEPAILTASGETLHYALYIIHGRWPEGEDILQTEPKLWQNYVRYLFRMTSNEDKWAWLKAGPITNNIFRVLNELGLSRDMQGYVLKRRPDLISKIKNLNPCWKTIYQHELELSRVDL
jgi:hypothetical protein